MEPGRIVVPLRRFDELRHREVSDSLVSLFADLVAAGQAAAHRGGARGRGGGRHHGARPQQGPPGWRRPQAQGKRPLKAADAAEASARDIVALCNKLSEGNFAVVARKLTAHADGGAIHRR